MNALTVNPLLLTMIAMVHRYRGQLPGRRVELYSEICDVLLSHWRKAKGMKDILTAAQKRVPLELLAAKMMQHRQREIVLEDAIEIISAPLQTINIKGKDAEAFLHDINESSGLLLETETKKWRFAHLTFQEYLAAAYLLEQKIDLDFSSLVDDSWWHEALRLYAAQGDATKLVQACGNKNSLPALSLAADCLDEARTIDKSIRDEAYKKLDDAIYSENQERRTLAAKVKLYRRLSKPWEKITDNISISGLISCAEYQLFLDAMRAKGIYCQPDHWRQPLFLTYCDPRNSSEIRGLRGEDAIHFCNWINDESEERISHVKYRLPTMQESTSRSFSDNDVYDRITQNWCLDSSTPVIGYKDYQQVSAIRSLAEKSAINSCFIDIPVDISISSGQLLYEQIVNKFSDIFIANMNAVSSSKISISLSKALKISINRYISINGFNIRKPNELRESINKTEGKKSPQLVQGLPFGLMRALIEDHKKCRPIDKTIAINESILSILSDSLSAVIYLMFGITESKESEDFREVDHKMNYEILTFCRRHKLDKMFYTIIESSNSEDIVITVAFQRAINDSICYVLSIFDILQSWSEKNKGVGPAENRTFTGLRESLESCYWWLIIVQARRRKAIPAWEGIRIVREQIE